MWSKESPNSVPPLTWNRWRRRSPLPGLCKEATRKLMTKTPVWKDSCLGFFLHPHQKSQNLPDLSPPRPKYYSGLTEVRIVQTKPQQSFTIWFCTVIEEVKTEVVITDISSQGSKSTENLALRLKAHPMHSAIFKKCIACRPSLLN